MKCSSRVGVVLVSLLLLAATASGTEAHGQEAQGQKTASRETQGRETEGTAAPAVAGFDVAGVRIYRARHYVGPVPADAPRLFVVGSVGSLPRYYYWATVGQVYAGSRFVLGYFGDGFADHVFFETVRFEREGSDIRLEFRYVAGLGIAETDGRGPACFFAAPLPVDLPDGAYRLLVTIRDSGSPGS